MSKKGHFESAKKSRGNHTTVIDAAEPLVKEADKMPYVTGISPGYIDAKARSREQRVKFSVINAGLLMKVYGRHSMQEIRLFTTCPLRVEKELSRIRL